MKSLSILGEPVGKRLKQRKQTWALAETGATGPASNPYKDPPGTAWLAVTGPVEKLCK